MCVNLGQLGLSYEETFRQQELEKASFHANLLRQIDELKPRNYRIGLWTEALIIPQQEPAIPRLAQFGWLAQKKKGGTWPVFNVRVEGGWQNKANDPTYDGPFHIFKNPYVRDLIMEQRCIVPCDFFVEQPEEKKDKHKFIIKRKDGQPIHLGGVYKEVVNEETGEVKTFFTLLTTAYTPITLKAGHKRSPLIIPTEHVFDYLDPANEQHHLEAFFHPHDAEGFIAYEVDPVIAKKKCPLAKDDPKLIEPVGEVMEPV